ncbi:mammalian cell entry protein [Mycobacterium arosiense ATCC BAA-1401 = DSM 45069]|uniref:Mammalian cell entry protein n=1 Tax=Mycobacterium arosiense ATCC BAA-1401 = DSM 45069 TaxID=1265311 RepID=A0A1W9ZC98_MYCAI|nr:mammalian cell entry protein [Mycobacterium arosiense ATCC BAA-1401 = DSM 45069]
MNVDSLPIPGSDYHDGYDITIEFANVLNLPERAKVVMDGTKVGIVTRMDLTHTGVDVTSRIKRGVVVPANIHSVLQQATVLGDTYIALERDQDDHSAAPPLKPGGRIPAVRTTSPPQLEDTIASMANFIGSGVIQKAQTSIIEINRVTPPRAEARQIASRVATDLGDLSQNMDNVELWLNGLSQAGSIMGTNAQNFKFWFSPLGVEGFHHNFIVTHFLAPLLPTLGTVYFNGYWLVPVLESVSGALEAVQRSKWAFDEELPRFQKVASDYLLPERKYPAINITSIVGPDGRELSGDVQQVLRMIGAMP